MIVWDEIEAVFLDAGNTLVSIDFERVAGELDAQGMGCEVPALRRAEAAARPAVSRYVADRSTEGAESFRFYLREILGRVEALAPAGSDALDRAASELALRLRAPGAANRLWRHVLPGVPEALASLRGLGLRLVVVSNSDGSVERGLAEVGLRGYLDAVVDSALVGFEKPDPRIFAHALAASGARRETTLHVGDLYAADVAGARAAGVHALLLDPHDDWPPVDCARLPDVPALARAIQAARAA